MSETEGSTAVGAGESAPSVPPAVDASAGGTSGSGVDDHKAALRPLTKTPSQAKMVALERRPSHEDQTKPLKRGNSVNHIEVGAHGHLPHRRPSQPHLPVKQILENNEPWNVQRVRLLIYNAASGKVFTGIMLVATVWALWGMDVYEVIQPDISNDTAVLSVVFICFILFCMEFIIFALTKDGYFNTFFFYLDFIAALSLLPDVFSLFGMSLLNDSSGGASSLTIARTGRAARAGTRAARIVRVIKLITLVKKGRSKADEEEQKESMIGGQLADLITQKVIVIVGSMLIVTSMFSLLEVPDSYSYTAELEALETMAIKANANETGGVTQDHFNLIFRKWLLDHNPKSWKGDTTEERLALLHKDMGLAEGVWPGAATNWMTDREKCRGYQVRSLQLGDIDMWCFKGDKIGDDTSTYDDLRVSPSERDVVIGASEKSFLCIDQSPNAQGSALVNIVQIWFIVILLGASSGLFNKEADALVIKPLAKMATLVRKMTANPLAEITDDGEQGDYETDFVESALKKFGKLLQVAFGEAGAEIIGSNMSNGGELDLMTGGQKLDSIFGFIVVFNFSECTECLQEEIFTFVNQIATYIHIAVNQHEGFTNKNIGEAWLLAWRMPQDGNMTGFTRADSALKAFIRVALQVAVCPKLKQLTDHPKIQEKLPGYATKMGFGLHVGWAIQGAIGSNLKIDASFLSPNVNMASRLEAATKQFKTKIMFSGQFYKLLSADVQLLCRKIDRVTVKGSIEPLELWTFDVPFHLFEVPEDLDIDPTAPYFEQFPPASSAAYRAEFHLAVEHYLAGRWQQAKGVLDECLVAWPEDGPGSALMATMGKFDYKAPENWRGYRELTDK